MSARRKLVTFTLLKADNSGVTKGSLSITRIAEPYPLEDYWRAVLTIQGENRRIWGTRHREERETASNLLSRLQNRIADAERSRVLELVQSDAAPSVVQNDTPPSTLGSQPRHVGDFIGAGEAARRRRERKKKEAATKEEPRPPSRSVTHRRRAEAIMNYVVQSGLTVAAARSDPSLARRTDSPRADADFEGSVKFKTYSENVETLDISSGAVVVDLSLGQTFELTVDEAVTEFTLLNPPTGSTAFSIKLTQDTTGYGVGIDTFKNDGGVVIPVYWPGGGVVPIPTTTASKTDIYSFKTFDGGSSLYGVVGGQNFA